MFYYVERILPYTDLNTLRKKTVLKSPEQTFYYVMRAWNLSQSEMEFQLIDLNALKVTRVTRFNTPNRA